MNSTGPIRSLETTTLYLGASGGLRSISIRSDCVQLKAKNLPMDLKMLERFNADVTLARHKSQRMSRGSEESLSHAEGDLVRFDQEKQSVNDGGALQRQYGYLRQYMADQYSVELPELL